MKLATNSMKFQHMPWKSKLEQILHVALEGAISAKESRSARIHHSTVHPLLTVDVYKDHHGLIMLCHGLGRGRPLDSLLRRDRTCGCCVSNLSTTKANGRRSTSTRISLFGWCRGISESVLTLSFSFSKTSLSFSSTLETTAAAGVVGSLTHPWSNISRSRISKCHHWQVSTC